MSEWCENRLEMTGKSVNLDILSEWIVGNEPPRWRHAVQQSIRLFLAGCAGILKPTKTQNYAPYPTLIPLGSGAPNQQNQAFEQWLQLLKKDGLLTDDNIRLTERLYHQSGLDAVTWENIPTAAQQTISSILQRQNVDWFGEMVQADTYDAGASWEQLAVMPERSAPCDMLQVIPTRLATELTGNSGMLKGISTTRSLYERLYGMQWPAGHHVRAVRTDTGSLMLTFDSPWFPPSGELIGEISAVFECQVQHDYAEPVNGIRGQDCYDGGDHVGSNTHLFDGELRPVLHLVEEPAREDADGITAVQQAL